MNVRPLTPADAAAVAELAGADEAALRGTPSRLQEADILAWWSHVELEPDSWLFQEAGTPVAAGWFHPYGEKGVGSAAGSRSSARHARASTGA